MAVARTLVLAVALSVLGCARVTSLDGERLGLASPGFRAYVESVFREQNRVADELAFALEGADAVAPELAAAEQRLLDACSGVNELATARRDGRRLGLRYSARVARAVPKCEQATRAASAQLAALTTGDGN